MDERKTLYNCSDDAEFSNYEYKQAIHDHNNCCLCGTSLLFTYEIDPREGYLVEESQCPECLVRTKANGHTIQ